LIEPTGATEIGVMLANVLETSGISKRFGVVQALSGVSVHVSAGRVHALVGENGAGKSTLMNIICGKLRPDEGELRIDGERVDFSSPLDAQRAGIAISPQEINLVPALSVAENVLLGAQAEGAFGVDWRETRARAAKSLAEIDDTIDPDRPARDLRKAQQQLVQIARATATSARILIFDEPTAALTDRESERLFSFIDRFKAAGGSILYISHRLDEILRLADEISVLRDGRLVASLDADATDKDEMVHLMAGRETASPTGRPPERAVADAVALKVTKLSRTGEFRDVSFELRRGEILGIAGLVGAGRTELGRCLFGVTKAESGAVEVFGEPVTIQHPADAIRHGLVYLPEERKHDGIFPLLSIKENMAIASLGRFQDLLTLRFSDMAREVADYVQRLRIKIGRVEDPITSLSGGNQQKVILARWLMRDACILILDEPTRGVDVNAKLEIQAVLQGLAARGLSILYISSELQEVLDVSDRVLVMHEGRVKGIVDAAGATQQSLLRLAMS